MLYNRSMFSIVRSCFPKSVSGIGTEMIQLHQLPFGRRNRTNERCDP